MNADNNANILGHKPSSSKDSQNDSDIEIIEEVSPPPRVVCRMKARSAAEREVFELIEVNGDSSDDNIRVTHKAIASSAEPVKNKSLFELASTASPDSLDDILTELVVSALPVHDQRVQEREELLEQQRKQSQHVLNVTESSCKWFQCDYNCPQNDLNEHVQDVHVSVQPYVDKTGQLTKFWKIPGEEEEEQEDEDSESSSCSMNFVCLWKHCHVYGIMLESLTDLNEHVQSFHIKSYPCMMENCDKIYRSNASLLRHLALHFKNNELAQSDSSQSSPLDTSNVSSFSIDPSNYPSTSTPLHTLFEESPILIQNFDVLYSDHADRVLKQVVKQKRIDLGLDPNGSTFFPSIMTPNGQLKPIPEGFNAEKDLGQGEKFINEFDPALFEKDKDMVTFHSEVISRHIDKNGVVRYVLRWHPLGVFDLTRVSEENLDHNLTRVIHKDQVAKLKKNRRRSLIF